MRGFREHRADQPRALFAALATLMILTGACAPTPSDVPVTRSADATAQASTPGPSAAAAVPRVNRDRIEYIAGSSKKICQLTGETDRQFGRPTLSQTATRFGLVAADHGYSFEHNGRLFFLLGDATPTAMFKGARNGPNDPPRQPSWNDLIAYTRDTNVEQCLKLEIVSYPNGAYKNPVPLDSQGKSAHTLETNESPEAGISDGGRMYVLFRTDNPTHTARPPQPLGFSTRMTVSVSDNDGETFRYLYDFSKAPDARFINVAIAAGQDGHLYFWGTQGGDLYRKSAPVLARKPVGSMGRPEGIQYLLRLNPDGTPVWVANEKEAQPLFHDYSRNAAGQPQLSDCMGELSVEWNRFIKRWVMLYNCLNNTPNIRGVFARVAEQPWGPWSEPETIFNPVRDQGYCNFIHRPITATSPKCDDLGNLARLEESGGNYGPYFLSRFTTGDEATATTTFYHMLDTWIPYTQVIMKATIRLR